MCDKSIVGGERENNTLLNRHVDPEESSCHYNFTCNCVFEEFIKLRPSLNATDTPRKRKDIFQGVWLGVWGSGIGEKHWKKGSESAAGEKTDWRGRRNGVSDRKGAIFELA